MSNESSTEYLFIEVPACVPYEWAAGPVLGRFLTELRDNARILGNQCPSCGRVMLPPRTFCGKCRGVEVGDNWLEVSDVGTLEGYVKAVHPTWDPNQGKLRTEPIMLAEIALDGAHNARIAHLLSELDVEKVHHGMRVRAVWKPREERVGDLSDILHFEIIDE
jgi:uncharacterized protein